MKKKNKDRNRTPNRSYGKIKSLPADVRGTVDEMIMQNFAYQDIVDFIKEAADVTVDRSMVSRYATKLDAGLQELRLAQENMRIMMEEVARYPDLDPMESIVRLMSSRVLDVLQSKSVEEWEGIDAAELIDKATKLARVATYKRDVDVKHKSIKDIAFDSFKEEIFHAMQQENPTLYNSLADYIGKKQTGAE